MTTDEKIEKLLEYAEYEGTEWSELIELLSKLYHYQDYMSGTLSRNLEDEICDQYEWASTHLRIVEEKVQTHHTVKTVEYIDEADE